MIVGNHNGRAHAFAHNATTMILHPEVHVEPHLLAVVTTVACYAEWQNDRTTGEVESIWTVELNDAKGCVGVPTNRTAFIFGIRASRANPGGNLARNTLGLKIAHFLEAGFSDRVDGALTSRPWQVEQLVTSFVGLDEHVTSASRWSVSTGEASAERAPPSCQHKRHQNT